MYVNRLYVCAVSVNVCMYAQYIYFFQYIVCVYVHEDMYLYIYTRINTYMYIYVYISVWRNPRLHDHICVCENMYTYVLLHVH